MKPYNENYSVTLCGRVWSHRRNKWLKPREHGNGYLTLAIDGKNILHHRLVAEVWLPNNEGKETVNHKDFNKSNNAVHNLEWMTRAENNTHAYENGNSGGRKPIQNYPRRPPGRPTTPSKVNHPKRPHGRPTKPFYFEGVRYERLMDAVEATGWSNFTIRRKKVPIDKK